MGDTKDRVHLYWATGCTSCLRAKEFLERNNVEFTAHNVVENVGILDEMEARGLPRRVPIVQRGDEWEDARLLEEVARIAGIEHEADPLPVEELYSRLETILAAAQAYVEFLEDGNLRTDIPNRPRSVGELCYHIFDIPEIFLEHEDGTPLTSFDPEPEWANRSTAALITYAEHIRVRLHDWYEGTDQQRDWSETANVYYGSPTVHEFLERTTWHSGQHTRQLEWMLTETFSYDIDSLEPAVWEDLPLPKKVWDAMP